VKYSPLVAVFMLLIAFVISCIYQFSQSLVDVLKHHRHYHHHDNYHITDGRAGMAMINTQIATG